MINHHHHHHHHHHHPDLLCSGWNGCSEDAAVESKGDSVVCPSCCPGRENPSRLLCSPRLGRYAHSRYNTAHQGTRAGIQSTHSLTHSFTHLLTHSLTYSLIHSLTHSFTHLLTHSLTYSLTRSPFPSGTNLRVGSAETSPPFHPLICGVVK